MYKVVKRQKDNSFAIVHWVGVSESNLLDAITKSVTRWVGETDLGKTTWFENGEILDIVVLSRFQDDQGLIAYLEAQGVYKLCIECFFDNDDPEEWTYDTVLVDKAALNMVSK